MYESGWFAPVAESVKDGTRGGLDFGHPVAHVACFRVFGHISFEVAKEITRLSSAHLQPAPLHVMHDWWAVTGYDAESRMHLTRYVQEQQRALGETHILLRSPLVVIGVSTANLVLRHRMKTVSDPAEFRAAYLRLCREATAPPTAHG